GDGWHADFDAGEVDVPPGTEFPLREHLTTHAAVKFFEHFETDDPVVHEDGVAFLDVLDEVGIVNVYRFLFFAVGALDGELEHVPGLQVQRQWQVAGADGGALRVHHDAAGTGDAG